MSGAPPSCGLTQAQLDAHPTWVGNDQRCQVIKGGNVCGAFYADHLAAPAPPGKCAFEQLCQMLL
jgi:hypothetical protein